MLRFLSDISLIFNIVYLVVYIIKKNKNNEKINIFSLIGASLLSIFLPIVTTVLIIYRLTQNKNK